MRDRKTKPLAGLFRERSFGGDLHQDVATLEAEVRVPGERARKEAALGEDLEAVADAEDVAALFRVRGDGLHDRTDLRERAATEIVAVAEATGDGDEVRARGERRRGVPNGLHLRAREPE